MLGLVIHMVAGGNGLISGFVSLFTKKGAERHVLAGKIYVAAMLIMAVTGFYYAYIRSVHITMLAGCLTIYLVTTGWLTVQKQFRQMRFSRFFPILLGGPVTVYGLFLSWRAYHGATDSIGLFVVPTFIYYLFTSIVITACIADFLILFGRELTPIHRIKRHLWRMCIPLYVACSSFFQGQQKVFPQYLQDSLLLSLPENIVLIAMIYFLFRSEIRSFAKRVVAKFKRKSLKAP